jgi:hypothetical protein
LSLIIDHKVKYRSEAFIAGAAMSCRKLGIKPGSNLVDLQIILDELEAHGVESIVSIPGIKRKGRLKIELIDDDPHEFPAFVKYDPRLTLFVQKGVWSRFKEGRSEERVIIAHEIGHIILHGDDAKPFAPAGDYQIRFAEKEDYAEWQADTFADHLLIPTELAQRLDDKHKLAFTCNVPDDFAARRLSDVRKTKSPIYQSSGDPCPTCGNFALGSNGTCKKCEICGTTKTLTKAEA